MLPELSLGGVMRLMAVVLYTVFIARFWFIKGLSEANFDREHANLKLQQCLEVIK